MNKRLGKITLILLLVVALVVPSVVSYANVKPSTGEGVKTHTLPANEANRVETSVESGNGNVTSGDEAPEHPAERKPSITESLPAMNVPVAARPSAAEEAAEAMAIDLKIEPKTAGKYEYLTGEPIIAYNRLTVSGDGVNLANPYVVISIPKKYVKDMPESSTASSLAKPPEITSNAGADTWEIKYTYISLSGGTEVAIPFDFKQKSLTTPKGAETVIKQQFFAADGTLLKENKEAFRALTIPPIIQKKIESDKVGGGFPNPKDPSTVDPKNTTPVKFVINVFNYNYAISNKYGAAAGTLRVFEKLPPGATLSAIPENAGWTYDAANHIAYKDVTMTEATSVTAHVYLDFPGFKFNTTYTNTAYVVSPDAAGNLPATPKDTDIKATLNFSLSITQYLTMKKSGAPWSYFHLDENKDAITKWTIKPTVIVPGGYIFKQIRDELVSPNLQYTSFRMELPSTLTLGKNRLIGYDADNKETVVATNIAPNKDYTVGTMYRKLVLKMDEPLVTADKEETEALKAIVSTRFNPATWADKSIIGKSNVNKGYMEYQAKGSGSTITMEASDHNIVNAYEPTLGTSSSNDKPSAYVNDVGEIGFFIAHVGSHRDEDLIKDPKFVTLLPSDGVEYVPGTYRFLGKPSGEPTIINNYKGSGRTALIYDHKGVMRESYTGKDGIKFKVIYRAYTKEGVNDFETYFTTKSDQGKPYTWFSSYKTQDIYDINGNGSTSDPVGYKKISTTFTPPQELIGSIKVEDSTGFFGKASDGADIGGSIKYKIRLENKKTNDVTTGTMLNVLPKKGDKAIVKNDAGNYVDRGSEYDVKLSGPITVPSGYTVKYSTESPVADATEIQNQKFVSADQVTDWSKVTMFKVVMNPGTVIKPGGSVEFTYSGLVENTKTLKEGAVARNSFAFSSTNKSFLETSSVTTPVVKYHTNGTLFMDANENGVKDAGEPILSGYIFTMVNTDTGEEVSEKTDSQGKYDLTQYHRGNYKVRLTKQSIDKFTILGKDGTVVNQISPIAVGNLGESDGFELSPTNKAKTVNGGVVKKNATLTINKTGEGNIPLAGVVYELTDTLTKEKVNLTTGTDGSVTHTGLIFGRAYTLVEKSAPEGYFVPTTSTEIIGTLAEFNVTKNFTNRLIKSNVQVTVVDKDDHSILISGAKVSLQRVDAAGKPIGDPIEKTTGADGKVSYADLTYGSYKITQITTSEGYVINDKPISVEVKTDGDTVKKTIENAKIKGAVQVTVVDKDDPSKVLPGSKVRIVRADGKGGPPVEIITNEKGIAIFDDLTYGKYVISQITTAEGYLLNTDKITLFIKEPGKTIKVNIANIRILTTHDKEINKDKTVKTGDGFRGELAIGGVLIGFIVMAVVIRRKRNE